MRLSIKLRLTGKILTRRMSFEGQNYEEQSVELTTTHMLNQGNYLAYVRTNSDGRYFVEK